MRHPSYFLLIVATLSMSFITLMIGCVAPNTLAVDKAAIRSRDIEWSKAFEMRDLEKVVSIYAEDTIALLPDSPRVVGREAAREINRKQFAILSGQWRPDKVEVSRSGDMGYSVGTYDVTMNDPKANPRCLKGDYVVVWTKDTDGSWRVAAEGMGSGLPSKCVTEGGDVEED